MNYLTKKNCWNCKVNLGEQIVLDEDFKTLREIATKLGVSYNQITELGPNGRRKTKKTNSPYITDITITRLSKGRVKKDKKSIDDEVSSEMILDETNAPYVENIP